MQKSMYQKQISLLILLLAFQLLQYLPFVVSKLSRSPLIFNFGDSNSDTGGYYAAYGLDVKYPYGRTFFHRTTGRSSDGRLIIDFLCEKLNVSYLTPYLDSLDPKFTNGVNFAIIGAATLPRHVSFNLNIQVQQFGRFKRRYLELRSMATENLEDALFIFDIGHNDLTHALSLFSLLEVIDMIPSYISELRDAMRGIYLLGGKNFWVHNTGPLGCLPREIAIRNNATDRDQYGCIKYMNDGVKAFNNKLYALCEELRSQMKVVYVDVYSIKYGLVAESAKYGFKNPLRACCGYGGAPYNYNPNITCLDGGSTACEEGPPYISWDGVHFTEAANAIVASKILSTQYSTPPFNFNFFYEDARTPAI